ncbi:MAG: helix-turn-helix domain-containing protein [Anaerolineales bacterium]|nr:helix-turn-helix domain-containing protein [Anaerolineales bacterium]MCB8991064.1 helix-turn-helix domain-containing protein [Ardenticatenaceae bacterium]MCB9004106.1 helix-turn-helix domain-containing protein [Ardenticatenaceae bacterium]
MNGNPQYIWDIGTAYDFFTSLDVLHHPDRYGLRGNWAAGVRSRLPSKKREFLSMVSKKGHIWSTPWLSRLSVPEKDAATVLAVLADMPPAQRLLDLTNCYMKDETKTLLSAVAERGSWSDEDKDALREIYRQIYQNEGKKKKIADEDLEAQLTIWADPVAFGEQYLAALETYYKVFFQEDEARIRPALEETAVAAKQFAANLPLPDLLEELSQGLAYEDTDLSKVKRLHMIPSFWTTPLSLFMPLNDSNEEEWIFLFGGRPANVSLVPGEVVPELMYNTLKALADPTRLRILRYLSAEPLTPAELARRLRLRPPTVIHHLDALRLARLVQLRLGVEGRRYAARREAVKLACEMLEAYLNEE